MVDITNIAKSMKAEQGQQLLDFFANIPEQVLAECKDVVIKKGVQFVREADVADTVYILVNGVVNASDYQVDASTYHFHTYEPLIMFGDMEMITEYKYYRATLKAMSRCRFITLSMKTYRQWMRQDPHAFWIQTRVMTKSFLEGARKDRRFLFLEGIERLYIMLLRMYDAKAKDGVLSVKLTRKELADEIGCSVRTINRIIKKAQELKMFRVKVSTITVNREEYIK